MRIKLWICFLILVMSVGIPVSCLAADPAPTISSVAPTYGYNTTTDMFSIVGTDFRANAAIRMTQGSTSRDGSLSSLTSTNIICRLNLYMLPAGAYNVTVINTDSTSATKLNAVTLVAGGPVPTISLVTPSTGPQSENTAVTITGTNFRSDAFVYLRNSSWSKLATISSIGSTSIACTLPNAGIATGTYDIKVYNGDYTNATKTNAFTVLSVGPVPTITSVSPTIGYPTSNWPVTIKGTNFRTNAAVHLYNSSVVRAGTIVNQESTQISCTLPIKGLNNGVYSINVTNTDGTEATISQEIAPVLVSYSP